MSVLSHSFGRRVKYTPNVEGTEEKIDENAFYEQRELKEGALNAVDSLRRELQEAKSELASLKSDNLVLARTRTIKRLLDNIKIQGTENISDEAVQRAIERGPLITRLRDELNDKNRELAEVTARLAQKESQLYDITIKLKRLEVKAEKDLDDSQSHVAEYANRNNELSIKVKKLEQTIIKQHEQISILTIQIEEKRTQVTSIEAANFETQSRLDAERKRLIAELNRRNENIVEEARAEGAHEIAMSRSESITMETEIQTLEAENIRLKSQISQSSELKLQLEQVRNTIRILKDDNSSLKAQNDDISAKLRKLRAGLSSSEDSISADISSFMESNEVILLKQENKRLKIQLQELDRTRTIQASSSVEVNIISNKAKRDEKIRSLIARTKASDLRVKEFLARHDKDDLEELSDRPVAPDYSSDESETFNQHSSVYLKSSSRSLTLSK